MVCGAALCSGVVCFDVLWCVTSRYGELCCAVMGCVMVCGGVVCCAVL